MGHHLVSFHASSIEFQNYSKVVCWRAGHSRRRHYVGPRGHVGFSSDAIYFKLGMELSSSRST